MLNTLTSHQKICWWRTFSISQATWAPWMINLCKWSLLTPGLSCPCQAKGCCIETATLGVASWPASSLFEGNYGILATLQVVCSGCCNGDIWGKWRERGQYVLRNYLWYLFIYFWFVCWYVGFVVFFSLKSTPYRLYLQRTWCTYQQ